MKIYTKGGDKGETSLYGGRRISKDDLRIEAYGTIDELNAHVGHLISVLGDGNDERIAELLEIQNRLFTVGANLASDPQKEMPTPDLFESDIEILELAMDAMDATLDPLRAFVLPGGSVANSVAHICRTVARRAERRIISLSNESEVNPLLIKYVNRLSDYFFVVSRFIAKRLGHSETEWVARK